ncbi:SDR family NAD(P)-dependent oxidoreductase [Streptomyces solisilvae]|uniref:type I polyketide synthase n=1 Tax=Streptomyces malaysiensis TaxID=92644 RepID=UPI0036B68306
MDDYDSAVAVIGMSGRFPGASDVDRLWELLMAGRPGLRRLTEEELAAEGVDPALSARPDYVPVAAPVEDIGLFDAPVFGLTPREAETTDPQHRLLLECSWEALESAGYAPTAAPGRVGVFAGCGFPGYMRRTAAAVAGTPGGTLQLAVGNERDSLTSLVSYKLGLTGPSVSVQTFCSTSLVAVHMACQSLLTFECDTALAGGAYLEVPHRTGYVYEEGGILSRHGQVRSFDAAADGTVIGNGVGVVALKRMTDAVADGDVVHAVILGSAVNNDGRARPGYTAPSVEGQAEVIEAALAVADVPPESLGYVECHATGTMLGDSIELAAMSRVFRQKPTAPCVLSSVKPSLGHLDRASGVVGLIRAVLAMRNKVLPQTPGFRTPVQPLEDARDRFVVLTKPCPWESDGSPRRAGVSSFGLGGTNAHVVIEEPPPVPVQPRPGPHLLTLSARSAKALDAATERLRDHLLRHPETPLADVAFTLQQSRSGAEFRRAVVCRDSQDATAALSDPGRWISAETRRRDPLVVVHAPPQGTVTDGRWQELDDVGSRVADLNGRDQPPSGAEPGTGGSTQQRALRSFAAALHRLGARVAETAITAERSRPRAPGGPTAADLPAEQSCTVDLGELETADGTAEWFLRTLARLWQSGLQPRWHALHPGRPRRVPLPTYPFQRDQHWLPAEEPDRMRHAAPAGRLPDPADWTYLASWRREPLASGVSERTAPAEGPWLVLSAEGCGDRVATALAEAGARVTVVRTGTDFTRVDPGEYRIRPDSREDCERVLAGMDEPPRHVVHAFSLGTPRGTGAPAEPAARFDDAQAVGFHSVRALVAALSNTLSTRPTDITILTDGTVGVVGGDLTSPEHATLNGLPPTVMQENPEFTCRHIDVDAHTAGRSDATRRLATRIVEEVAGKSTGPVALRAGDRWVRDYTPHPLPAPTPMCRIPEKTVVLVTGGLGDVGLVLARHLAARGCRLVLTARSELPPRDQWRQWLAEHGDSPGRTGRHIRSILALEEQGAEVLAVSADVADAEQMAEVVRRCQETFGPPRLVVHGAGVSDPAFFGLAHELDPRACDQHFRAKVHGFLVLQHLLRHQPDVARITLSSISAVLGGISLGPYAAANAALDAYALAARADDEGDWITVDWDTWGIVTSPGAGPGGSVAEYVMRPEEGVDVFERAVAAARDVGHLVVSTGSLDARLTQWATGSGSVPDGSPDGTTSGRRHPRPEMMTPFVAPDSDEENRLAEIWSETLGLDRVGTQDNFFELGGHSLIAMQLMSRVRREFRSTVPVNALLEYPTVSALHAVMNGRKEG